jgi:putative ABC transport system ATP-binding protein
VEVRSLYREPERAAQVDHPALELIDVFRIYRSGDVETVALRGLSMRIERAEVVAVFGPSGSGKSTFLHLAAGLDVPSAGEVRVGGRSLARLSDDDLAAYRARDIAIVFQSDNLWPALSARENVETSLRMAGVQSPAEAAVRTLAWLGLEHRGRNRAAALSGGEQQRVAIAAAAARNAGLVLADEPTGELDQANERLVLEGLLRLRDEYGSTVVVVTHSPRVAEAADHVVEIRDGRAVA